MTTFKNVFDEKFNQEQIKQSVIKKNKKMKQNTTAAFVFACLFVLAIPFISLKENSTILDDPYDIQNDIQINQLNGMGLARLDVDIQTLEVNDLNQQYPFLNNLTMDDAYTLDTYAMYGRKDRDTTTYDVLNCYVLSYTNNENSIRIAFSETNEPVRDYYLSRERPECSFINDIECIIYQYEDMMMVTFEYNNLYFDIETSNVEIDNLIDIIKQVTN